MLVRVCVGSSCHLKGSEKIIELLQQSVAEHHLEDKVELAGSFCLGKCNRIGVSIDVDGEIFTGIIPETFSDFFNQRILSKLR